MAVIETPESARVTAQEAMDGSPSRVYFNDLTETGDAPEGKFGYIAFQCGPVAEVGLNGTTIEAVTDVLIRRLQGFQAGKFACRENALAITKLEEAQHWLRHRTWLREQQGVEGTNVAHASR